MSNQTCQPIKNIIIVGGGTAGWLSAAYLHKALNSHSEPQYNITLIESSDIGRIGVGEATIPNFAGTLRFLGISETEFMVECHGTFKLAIKFRNWSGLPGIDTFWHPFGPQKYIAGTEIPDAHYWLKQWLQGHPERYASSCFETVDLAESQKAPRLVSDPEYSYQKLYYAYHLDAGLFAGFLKKKTTEAGVRHIIDNVVDVVLDERGFIDRLVTQNHGSLAAELFIDCSGFQGLLINQTLQEPFISYSDSLLCDKAVAISVPYDDGDPYNENHQGINPYTSATALSSGWVWQIPLVKRSGTGYVYSSKFTSPAAAEQEIKQFLGANTENLVAKHLNMRIGKTRNSWVKNCVSIGLAGGFIEPLESTGIYLIEHGLEMLVNHFPNRSFSDYLIRRYNEKMTECYEELRDFIVMHYCLTHREDTAFWRTNRHELKIPDSLQAKLEHWQQIWPLQQNPLVLFPEYSYLCILAGMGQYPQNTLPILDAHSSQKVAGYLSQIKDRVADLEKVLPSHVEYLKQKAMMHKNGIPSKRQLRKTEPLAIFNRADMQSLVANLLEKRQQERV
ncbi:MAG TPA: tryptophan halogenase family protein [Kamptonema sp.]|nr:tryptophan halogenase family protein [Kamptonema sp.]